MKTQIQNSVGCLRVPRSLTVLLILLVGLTVSANGMAASLTLTWTASTGTVDGYTIERADSATGPWTQLAQIAASPTSYTDSSVAPATTYYYRVSAYNAAGNSGYSNVAGGTPAAPAVLSVSPANYNFGTVATGTAAQFSFTVSNSGGSALSGSASVAAPFSISSGGSFNLAAGASATVLVSFTPPAVASYNANVSFTSTGGNSVNVVTGTGSISPVAAFTATPTNGTAKLTVTFTDTSTGTITNRVWSFGDGTTLTTTNTSFAYTYSKPGTNTVTLSVGGPLGVSTNTKPAYVKVMWYPPGDVDGSGTVTTNDLQLINQVLTGLRSTNDAVFQTTGFISGDVNQDGVVNSSDSLLIKQVMSGLREYVVTEIMPSARVNTAPTTVIIAGIGYPTNGITAVTFGAPINITVSNVTVFSEERIQVLLPAGGGLGTGTVSVIASPNNGVTSFGVFINK
ncbi:MAG: PKD domain-containing protein [Verrucomicrobiota bacterium]